MYTNRTGNLKRFFSICESDKVLDVTQDISASVCDAPKDTFDYIFWQLNLRDKGNQTSDVGRKVSQLFKQLQDMGKLVLYCDNPYSVHAFAEGLAEAVTGECEKHNLVGSTYHQLKALQEELGRQLDKQYHLRWFYPYPNVEFPCAIYSEEYLPRSGECDDNFYQFDKARIEAFEEKQAVDVLVRDGMYPYLAHAYVLVISKETDLPVFTRFSNERREDRQIRTDMYKTYVTKKAMQPAAISHVMQMRQHYEKLSPMLAEMKIAGRSCQMNEILESDQRQGSVSFAFAQGESLESCFDGLLLDGKETMVREELLAVCSAFRKLAGQQSFETSAEFENVFGSQCGADLVRYMEKQGEEQRLTTLPLTDIDLVCQNILLGEKAVIIDYEWTFDFPIPVDYLVFRFLYFYLEAKNRRAIENVIFGEIYEQAGITQELRRIFLGMETNFQRYVQSGARVLRNEFDLNGKPVLGHEYLVRELDRLDGAAVEIQYASGERKTTYGKLGEDGVRRLYLETNQNAALTLTIKAGRDTANIEAKLYRIGTLMEDGSGKQGVSFETNGECLGGLIYLFDGISPQITLKGLSPQTEYVHVSLEEVRLTKAAQTELIKTVRDMQFTIANREQQIADLKNSASWKLTKPLRRMKGTE